MKVRPLGDKILVKRDEAATKTESGIFLPETAKDKPKQGKVLLQAVRPEWTHGDVLRGLTLCYAVCAGHVAAALAAVSLGPAAAFWQQSFAALAAIRSKTR